MADQLSEVIDEYAEQLSRSPTGREWLSGRGITQAERFRLGWVGQPVNGHERFRGGIVIPYVARLGRVMVAKVRHTREGVKHKYGTFPSGRRVHPYNVAASDAAYPIVVEGEFDAMILSQLGYPAVALPGATTWDRAWRWLFRDAELVTVIGDSDKAGRNMAGRVLGDLSQLVPVREVRIPPIKDVEKADVNDVFLHGGADAIKELLA